MITIERLLLLFLFSFLTLGAMGGFKGTATELELSTATAKLTLRYLKLFFRLEVLLNKSAA